MLEEQETRSKRELLIRHMQEYWIKGVLADTLQDAQIPQKASNAKLKSPYQAYLLPINTVFKNGKRIKRFDYKPQRLYRFSLVFHNLLIVGSKGSGKSVMLLQLAQRLLENDASYSYQPVPVILNLALWESTFDFETFLYKALALDYGADKKLSYTWINNVGLVYLFDGLDELTTPEQAACLQEVLAFMYQKRRRFVLTCRFESYELFQEQLNQYKAIQILPWERETFQALLQNRLPNPDTVETILQTFQADEALWSEVNKAFFLNLLISNHQDGQDFVVSHEAGSPLQKVQAMVITPYIKHQLGLKAHPQLANKQIERSLAWLSHQLLRTKRDNFYVELLTEDWLSSENSKKVLKPVFLSIWYLSVGCPIGLIVNALTGLTGFFIWYIIWALLGGALAYFLQIGDLKLKKGSSISTKRPRWLFWFKDGVQDGIALVGVMGLLMVVMPFMQHGNPPKPKEAIGSFLLYLLAVMLLIIVAFAFGFTLGLPLGLVLGFMNVLKHGSLRLLLEYEQVAPRRFDTFLEYLIEQRIMRRAGASAIFIHRYILEYFADEWENSMRNG